MLCFALLCFGYLLGTLWILIGGIVTHSARELSQDCTSMIMPSGVSSFFLDCMDSDMEAGDLLPSIETLCKADTYDEGTGLVSEEEMLHCYNKNSTLLSFSDAVNIGMQHPPNLSSILELSPVIDGQPAKEPFFLSPPQAVSPLSSSPLVRPCEYSTSLKNTLESKSKSTAIEECTPVTKRVVAVSSVVKKKPLTGKHKPIKCRKVTFSDVISMQSISMIKVSNNDLRRNAKEPSSETARFLTSLVNVRRKLFSKD